VLREKDLLIKLIESGVQFSVSLDSSITHKIETISMAYGDEQEQFLVESNAKYNKKRVAHFGELK
jgi:hypothetical protein